MTTRVELPRFHRVLLATLHYGLYMIGHASTDSERIDEDCCMDNCGVPIFQDQVSEKQQALIDQFGVKS